MILVVHYWDLEKCVIGTTQRPSFLPFSLLRVSLERPIDSCLVTSSCVCLRTVCGLSPLKTEFLLTFWGLCKEKGGGAMERGLTCLLWSHWGQWYQPVPLNPANLQALPWYLGGSYFSFLFPVNTLLDAGKESKSVDQ